MITKHILNYLKENNRLIIPDLGAFIVKVNSKTNLKDLTFNDVIKFNDAAFANFIANTTNVDVENAKQQIADYVEKVIDTLNNNEKVNIEDAGFLLKDAKGYVNFTSEKDGEAVKPVVEKTEEPKAKVEAPKEQKIKAKKVEEIELIKEDIFESKVKEVKTEKPKEISKSSDSKLKAKKVAEASRLKQEEDAKAKKAIADHKKNEEKQRKIADAKKKEDLKQKEKAEKQKNKEAKKAKETNGEKKSKKGLIVILVIVLLIIALAVVGFIFKQQVVNYYNELTNKVEQVEIVDEVVIDSLEVDMQDTVAVEPAIGTEEVVVSSDLKFHVIAGSFTTNYDAKNFSSKLRKQGYSTNVLPIRNGKIRVAYGSFATRAEGVALRSSLISKGVQTWLLSE